MSVHKAAGRVQRRKKSLRIVPHQQMARQRGIRRQLLHNFHRAAGPELLEECRTLNGCETGQAKITKGYRLPARYVIHTVGPVWHGGGYGERELLASCYRSCLELAAEYSLESVAFPMISAGAYGYPKDEAMGVAVEEISRFLLHHEMAVFLVVFGRQEIFTGKKLFRDVTYPEAYRKPP